MCHVVYLSLGSNMGDPVENCRKAIEEIKKVKGIKVSLSSSFYETAPVGYKNQANFINAAVRIETELSPMDLLEAIKRMEKDLGRRDTFRWGPRVIDIDILLYDDTVIESERLRIPHPGMLERAFALIPLAEIGPEAIHPHAGKTIAELAGKYSDSGDIKRLGLK